MLHALELENFKAFGKRARVPFAPITLIFGENSAGKSTILQVLYLLKQTLERRDTGDLLLARTPNHIVDLGSFQEMLFDHDLERTLSIRVETSVGRRYSFRPLFSGDKIAIEFGFKRSPLDQEVLLDGIGIYDGKSAKRIAKFEPLDRTEISREFQRRPSFFRDSRGLPVSISKLAAVKCVWLTEESEQWKQEFEWCLKNKEDILNQLKERLNDLKHSSEELREDNDSLSEEINSLEDGIKFFSPNSNFDLKPYISRRHGEEMDTVCGIQGFLPVGIVSRKRNPITNLQLPLRRQYDRMLFDVAQLAVVAGRALEQTLEDLFPISPFRIPPERLYTFRGTTPQNVGYRGDLLPDYLLRHPERVEEANKWLKKLDIDYELEIKSAGAFSGDLFEIRLIDGRRKKPVSVSLSDVGFGVSQLLPFIVQSLVAEEQIISIEQPEVHVHPKLQADLGDLLAAAIKKDHPNQFIVETHSEHLILRLQRLVRKQQIKPEDVSVIYVSRGPEGAKAERLRLDEEGDFIDEWPNGFFAERLNELR